MEYWFKFAVAIGGGVASYLWGGWSAILQTLVIFVALDYVTGVIAAGKHGKLSSEVGFWGILTKIAIFAVIAVAHLVDNTLGNGHAFRDATITFFLCNEALSILENSIKLNVPVPEFLKKAVESLKEDAKKDVKKNE
ncbi:holin family protein [Thermoactinomyces sp. DSM 45892]|uniref:phage holin family protein n=1 Tax=Thermoactinomyces sp. DSM 45892 TaxID=1882753 RepID=UPI000894399C|nr:phage holin family protein [Thermoactinomyces sp. DSM 45892]SDY69731.1 toxin secretion/phage lysis holin [Thermoactinomyces sp. DSM 45892]